MQSMAIATIVAATGLLVSSPPAAAGQGVVLGVQANPVLPNLAAPRPARPSASPFSRLFQPSPAQAERRSGSPPGPEPTRPTVSCGMTLVPVDPRFDALMRKPVPTQPKAATRSVNPTPCEVTR